MVPAKETAEEQLLRMIEGPGGGPMPSRGPSKWVGVERFLEPFWRGREAFRQWRSRRGGHKEPADRFLWQLQLTGRIFWVVLGGLGVYLIVDLWVVQPTAPVLTVAPDSITVPPSTGVLAPDAEAQLTRAAEYRSRLAARNPFRLEMGRITDAAPTQTTKAKLLQLTEPLAIVGINRGPVPEALIEDVEAGRTYFVKVGDTLNEMTVKSIDGAGVTVTYEGEEALVQ